MPQLGEIKKGREIGKTKGSYPSANYIWAICTHCKIERWVLCIHGLPRFSLCRPCSLKIVGLEYGKKYRGEKHHNWKGGKIRIHDGYIMVRLYPDDFFYPMCTKASKSYVLEHRLVMAKHLGRCLHPWEIVHHKNSIRDDNRIENLQLFTDDRHKQISLLERRIKQLEDKVEEQDKRIRLLQWQLKQERANIGE